MTDISFFHSGNNAALIVKVAELGYIKPDDSVLDATVGVGTWWNLYHPEFLITNDLDPNVDANFHKDFIAFPDTWRDGWDVVCYDPPYKLNGTGGPSDARYGCEDKVTVEDRKSLIYQGFRSCSRVVKPGGYLLVKVQDQVAGGKVHWLTQDIHDNAWMVGLTLVERFDMPPARPQPAGRRQLHARRGSTLLIFQRKVK